MRWGTQDRDRGVRERLVAGAEDALAEVYDTHAAAVYGLALHLTSDRAAAEDITQDVFVQLWERPDAYDPDRGPLRAWLCTVARRRAIDLRRRATTRERYAPILAQQYAPVRSAEDDAVNAVVVNSVRSAVQSLPEPHRSAIVLAYYRGLTYREVAEALAIPEGTAKSRLRLGLRRLADRLAADGIQDA